MKRTMYKMAAAALILTVLAAGASISVSPARGATQNDLLAVAGVSWYSPNSTALAVPGSDGVPLFVTFEVLANGSAGALLNVSLGLSSPFSYYNSTGLPAVTNYSFSPVRSGSEFTVMQLVNISGSGVNGYYPELLSYAISGGAGGTVTGSSRFLLPLLGSVNIVAAGSLFGSPASPIPGTPGMKYVPLSVSIENTGNSAVANITATYAPSGALYGARQTTYVSAMTSYGFATLTFLVSISSSAQDGFVSQNMTLFYNSANHTVEFSAPVTGYSNISMIGYYTNPPAIYQDEKYVQLTVFTANAGNSFASDVNISASSAGFDVLTPAYSLPAYPAEEALNFTFLLNAHNYSGPAPVTVAIGGTTYRIPLYLKSEGDLAITSTVPSFNPGNSNQLISFTLANDGNTTLWDVNIHLLSVSIISIHIPSSNPFAALTADNVTFAELSPGQSVTVTFLMDTSSSAAVGTYPAQLFVTWMHNDSLSQFSKTYTFNEVVVKSSVQKFTEAFTLNPLNIAILVVIIVVVIALVAIGVRKSRAGRKKDSAPRRRLADGGGPDAKEKK